MGETIKLFCEDPYRKDFEAEVLEIVENKVMLSQTCFYPEGGGQVGDTGIINDIKVTNTIKEGSEIVKIDDQDIPSGGKIYHILEKEPDFKVEDIVKCKIDWDKRFKTMQLHSASHIMEHFLMKVFGEMPRLGSNVDENKDRGEYESEERLDEEKLQEVQKLCNEFIAENHEIKTWQSEENENIRVWQCVDIKMYCGGTHVKNTSEIGKIRLKRKNKGAGRERVETYLD